MEEPGDDGFTARVAASVATTTFEALPDDVVEVARQCVLDWFGVTIAGAAEPCAALIVDELGGVGTAGGRATVVGRAERFGMLDAALANGTASHALDYDDVNDAMLGHPSVPILGGLLALAEQMDASGRELVSAFVAGYEAECRIGRAIGVEHYQRGFHATGTVGTFGAAAACARLLGLDARTTEMALGLAAAQASGLKSMFGTMVKPLHAGKATANGLLAARLAAKGYVGVRAAIETEQGFAETHTEGFDPDRGWRPARRRWFLLDNLFKFHAACFQTHSAIEGLRALREMHRFVADDVDEVVVEAEPGQVRMCAIPDPRTGLEAKFSLRHTAAMVLAGVDTAVISSFSDEAVHRPDVLELRRRINVRTGRAPGGPTPVSVHLRDGRVLRAAHDVWVPTDDLADQRHRLGEKFEGLAAPVLGSSATAQLRGAALTVDTFASVRPLLALSRPEG